MTDGRGVGETARLRTEIAALRAEILELKSWRELWVDKKIAHLEDCAEETEKRVENLEGWKRVVLAIGALMGAVIGFFSPEIKNALPK